MRSGPTLSAIALILLLAGLRATALDLAAIGRASPGDSRDDSLLLAPLKRLAAPETTTTPLTAWRVVLDEQSRAALQASFEGLRRKSQGPAGLRAALQAGLAGLYLSRGGSDQALVQAERFVAAGRTRFAHSRELAWLQGLLLLGSARALEGVRLLDSLRQAGLSGPEYTSDYVCAAFAAFLPGAGQLSHPLPAGAAGRGDPEAHAECGAAPASFSWDVISYGRQGTLPAFVYEAAFELEVAHRLRLPQLSASRPADWVLPDTSLPLLYGFRARGQAQRLLQRTSSRALYRIFIDLNDTGGRPVDYLGRRIGGLYDSIAYTEDLARYKALAVRCHDRFVQRRYAAYIVFDRTLGELFAQRPFAGRLSAGQRQRRVRITVSLECGREIMAPAERRLQAFLAGL